MPKRIRHHLSYANVMSSIAVFIALGGGAAYAANEYNGDNIQDGTLTGADIQGSFPDLQQGFIDGTLTTEDIRDGSLFPSDLADNTLGPADILQVGADEIGPDSVSGPKVANDSLDGFDIQNLSGSDLIDGSVGADDLAPGVRGFTRIITRRDSESGGRGDRINAVVNCPTGYLAVSGGYGHSSSRDPEDFSVSSFGRFGTRGWQVVGRHVGGIGSPRLTVQVSVNCVQ